MGREWIKLQPKCDGYIGRTGKNNKGVFQGSPMGATLFIIYAEQMMTQYHDNIPSTIKENIKRGKQGTGNVKTNGQVTSSPKIKISKMGNIHQSHK